MHQAADCASLDSALASVDYGLVAEGGDDSTCGVLQYGLTTITSDDIVTFNPFLSYFLFYFFISLFLTSSNSRNQVFYFKVSPHFHVPDLKIYMIKAESTPAFL